MNKAARSLFTVLVSVFLAVILMNIYSPTPVTVSSRPKLLTYSEFRDQIVKGNIDSASWQQDEITGKLKDGKKFVAKVTDINAQSSNSLVELMNEKGVNWKPEGPPISNSVLSFLSVFAFPIILFLMFYFLFIRPAQMGGNQALNFGRNRAKKMEEKDGKITFDDVAGIDEAKQELSEVVDFLKNSEKYTNLGAKIPKGVLLTGPPGVGKTHLARAIAGEAGVPFYFISGSDFVEMFVGVGAARVRDLFETAKANRPSVIFVDEIDAVGRQRGTGMGGGHDEREQTLNQLLVEMDGFENNIGVVMIAATNRPDVLDPALLRPGRFDRRVVIDVPDIRGREEILKIHAKNKKLDEAVDLSKIAKRSAGFTGADLANTLNEAALLAARNDREKIIKEDVEEALDRVIAGPERKSRIVNQIEKEVIAYHEAGHAIVGELLDGCDPVHKVTILPRGMSLGSTWSLPEEDRHLVSEQELRDQIAMTLGGRVAEEVVYGRVWTGASSDLERVSHVARSMVCEYGMSPKLGTRAIGRRARNPFMGRDYAHDERDYSEEVAKLIDEEIRNIVELAHRRATKILTENRDKLNDLVNVLLERETIDREEFLSVLKIEDRKSIPSKLEVIEDIAVNS